MHSDLLSKVWQVCYKTFSGLSLSQAITLLNLEKLGGEKMSFLALDITRFIHFDAILYVTSDYKDQ